MSDKDKSAPSPVTRLSGDHFRQWRENNGFSQESLAKRMGRHQSYISLREDGKIPISLKDVWEASAAMDKFPEEFLERLMARRRIAKLPRREASLQTQWPAQHLPDFIPVYDIHEFRGNRAALLSGPAIDWTPRPPILLNAKDAYAVYVSGISMAPRFRPGQRLYVNPHRPPAEGHGVLVFNRDDTLMIRQYLNEESDIIRLVQYKPHETFEIQRNKIDAIHMIVGTEEV